MIGTCTYYLYVNEVLVLLYIAVIMYSQITDECIIIIEWAVILLLGQCFKQRVRR